MDGDMVLSASAIQSRIYTIRGMQVMLDRDLAELYGVETKVLNRAVKRNIERFPETFRYQLTDAEYEEILRFQNGTSSTHGGRRYLPYVFTEQGISMLSAVLRSPTAIAVSIKIIETFVHMRKLWNDHATLLRRFERVEHRLLEHDGQFEKIFQAIEGKTLSPKQGIFFDGQIFDAHVFVSDLIKSAEHSIILIDNYIDENVLALFTRNQSVDVTIYTRTISRRLKLDLQKYNAQYRPIEIRLLKVSHDRFMILDGQTIYHIGASLKDLGKKWFAFSRMDREGLMVVVERLRQEQILE
jgi:hypothetical protein